MIFQEILQNEINVIYGPEYGNKTGKVLIPAFLGDFRKVLENGEIGHSISEEYMTEDKKIHLILKGERRLGSKGYDMMITSCLCNDKELLSNEISIFPSIIG
ncbi:hypothetical protein [Butyrivibrio sp. WCE2006]|uniref:hypothetical protein n=1 Tax=Butyrivibrio sp. WCE2006 TaxID=1410611 RepID=UPI0005D207DA|nr:hypothetical protein [Butyrivibrio sp. WCE2006]